MKALTLATMALFACLLRTAPQEAEETEMYGLIGKLVAAPDERDALVEALRAGSNDMPGCLSYVIAKDAEDPDAIWVTEVWSSEESHRASLQLPGVREAIARGRPFIAAFGERFVTVPVGGHGLARTEGSKPKPEEDRARVASSHRATTPEHEWLLRLRGEWTADVEARSGPGKSERLRRTETVRSLGGLWVLAESSGASSNGTPVDAVFTIGYDSAAKRFVGSWIDSMQSRLWTYVGDLDQERDVLTLEAEGPSFFDPETTAKYRETIRFAGADERTLVSSVLTPDGEWKEYMVASYHRLKPKGSGEEE